MKYLADINHLDQNHVLIIDSYKCHIYNLAFFIEMRDNNTHVMAILPHTSHILQSLDSALFIQFKRNWQNRLLDWNFANNTNILAKHHFFEVFWPAWRDTMSVAKIQSGFRKTGVFSVNKGAIPKAKYAPSQVTDSKNSCWLQKFIC